MKKFTPRPRSQLVAAVLPGLTRRTASAIHCAMCSGRRTQRMPANKNARALTMLMGPSLHEFYMHRLLLLKDLRISKEGVIVIKAQQYRSQEQNREDALDRLRELIRGVAVPRKKREATKPSKAARQRRLEGKVQRGALKTSRRTPVSHDDRSALHRTRQHPLYVSDR